MTSSNVIGTCTMLFLALVPLSDVDATGTPPETCTNHPCKASLVGDIGLTIVGGTSGTKTFATNENVYGPFEAGFNSQQDTILSNLCGNTNIPTSSLYIQGGIDTYTAEQTIAAKCATEIPRFDPNSGERIGLLDACGGHTGDYHFHEGMKCLYEDATTGQQTQVGHSIALAEVFSEVTSGVKQRLYGKWENFNPDSDTYVLPAVDACNGHFGPTPESPNTEIYHYHTTDLPPYTVGCFGPNKDSGDNEILVSPTVCRALYDDLNGGCGGGDTIAVTTPTGTRSYDPWCPCWEGLSNVEGGEPDRSPPTPPPAVVTGTVTIELSVGWTWISSPLFTGDIQDALGDLGGLVVKFESKIKSQTKLADWFGSPWGWYGSLSLGGHVLSPLTGYKLKMTKGGPFAQTKQYTPNPLSATAVLPDAFVDGGTHTLSEGWTLIGWPSFVSGSVTNFDDSLLDVSKLANNDQMKSKGSTMAYIKTPEYTAWFGGLKSKGFEPGQGYAVKLASANALTSTFGTGPPLAGRRELDTISVESPVHEVPLPAEWPLAPEDFEFSMSIMAAVVLDGIVAEDGHLAAFVGGELHGVAAPTEKVPVGSYKGYRLYSFLAFGQQESQGATVTFQFRHSDGRIFKLEPTTTFTADASVGTPVEPFVIAHTISPSPPSTVSVSTVMPTPDSVSIPDSVSTPDSVPAFPATEGLANTATMSISIGGITGIAIGAFALLLVVLALCARNAMSGKKNKKGTSTAEVVPRKSVDVDVISTA